jgi:NAD(P)-dependent dehydrogenase (short-subunit alcohol dehydrogenase family)
MARIFITGSSDGLGQLTSRSLIEMGHHVFLHARNAARAKTAIEKNPKADKVFIGDLSKIEEIKRLAFEVNEMGSFDVIIHNAGVYQTSPDEIFRVNTLAPYILTCLIQKPKRIIYLSSGMHQYGEFKTADFKSQQTSYSNSKLHVLMLCFAVARKWKDVFSNTVNPGWVPTKMGGKGAPDNLNEGYKTQVWLAASEDNKAMVSGHYFFHQKVTGHNPLANDFLLQESFLKLCKEITGVDLQVK